MVLALLFYGSLAALALIATWHERDLRWVGIMLVVSFAISNAIWFGGTPDQRPGAYTMTEIFIIAAAAMAFERSRYKLMIVVVAISTLSIAANVAFASLVSPTIPQVRMYEIITNICFAAECLVATTAGVTHGYRVGRLRRRADLGRAGAEPHASREDG